MFSEEQAPFISRAPLPTIGESQEVKSSNEVTRQNINSLTCSANDSYCKANFRLQVPVGLSSKIEKQVGNVIP